MNTVIYLSNQKIDILVGKRGNSAEIRNRLSVVAPEGCIINGLITDNDRFAHFIGDIWKENGLPEKNVILVLNSTKFVGQTLEFPKMGNDSTLGFVRRSFAGIDKNEERLHGYVRLDGDENSLQRVYAESVSRELITEYLELFGSVGIRLKGIYSGEGSLINLVNSTTVKKYKNFILMIADGLNLSTLLFTDGAFRYYNSVRIFHAQGTGEYAGELARTVSQIRQFMKANQIESSPDSIILAGVRKADLPGYSDSMKNMGVQTPVEIYSADNSISGAAEDVQEYLPAVSGLFESGIGSNYLATIQKEKKGLIIGSENEIYFCVLGITAAVMLALYIVSFVFTRQKQNELNELMEHTADPVTVLLAGDYDDLMDRNEYLVSRYYAVADINENLATYPWATGEITDILYRLAEGYAQISISRCNADSGTTDFSAEASDPQKISDFIGLLKEQDFFCDVSYGGYTYNENGSYHVDVSCVLAEAAGRK